MVILLKNYRAHRIPFLLTFTVVLFAFPVLYSYAQGYVPLSGIPELQTGPGDRNVGRYVNTIYVAVVGLGALFAVIKIALAGVKYSMSDVVTNKEDARKDIYGALFGLGILLVPFLVLYTIYPGLVNLNFLGGVSTVNRAPPVVVNPATSQEKTPIQTLEEFAAECRGRGGTPAVSPAGVRTCNIPSPTDSKLSPLTITDAEKYSASGKVQTFSKACVGAGGQVKMSSGSEGRTYSCL